MRKIGGPGPAIIFLAALAFRLVYFLTARDDPLMTYVDAVPDASLYHNWAVDITGGVGTPGSYYIGPAYAFFLAAAYKLFGVHLYGVILVQLFLGAATAALVYVLARRLFGDVAAAVAGGVWAVYLPAIFFDTQILPGSMTLFLVTGALLLLAVALEFGRRWALAAAVAGALFGGAALARPNLLLFVPALALWPLLRRGTAWRAVAVFAVPVILVVGAATARNKIAADEWVVISSQGGVNFFIGNNRDAPGSFMAPRGTVGRPEALNEIQTRALAEGAVGRRLTAAEASRWWLRRGLGYLVRNPGDAALLYGRKLSLLTNNYEVTLNADFGFRRNFSVLHRVPIPYYGLLFALGTVGLALGWRGGPPGRRALAIFFLAVALSVILFFVVDWYRLPLAPALAVAAGYGVSRIWDDWRRRRWGSAGLALAAAASLLVFAWLPGVGCDRDGIATQSYFNYGTYYLVQGDLEKAATHFRTALSYKDNNAYALGYLGLVYDRQGRDDLASYYYLKSLDIDPLDAETNYFLAANLASRDKCRLAIPLLETAVDTFPAYVDAWRLLAECHVKGRDFAAGAEAYRRLLTLVPRDARALARYASVLMETGEFEEGVAAARRAIALEPTVAGAHLLLGKYYFVRGEAAAAARELEAERRVSPRSLQVLSYLVGCYLNLGDGAAADAAYRDYLALGGTPMGKLEAKN
ncbi:MAG: tetratricopeptide repeat protein [candidate division Zixibacteria bacterium]|nr:tetratricopeptide repeat protein [candidate division Zixibacteria bacterium]